MTDALPSVIAVTARDDYSLLITFEGGEIRRFDMRPYLERGVFGRLKNTSLFKAARIEYGTVTWPGGLDIAPETLFKKSLADTNPASAA